MFMNKEKVFIFVGFQCPFLKWLVITFPSFKLVNNLIIYLFGDNQSQGFNND